MGETSANGAEMSGRQGEAEKGDWGDGQRRGGKQERKVEMGQSKA
ncbi:hypothetical protein [Salmonella enterica]